MTSTTLHAVTTFVIPLTGLPSSSLKLLITRMIYWLSLMLCLKFSMGAIANNTAMSQLELGNFEFSVLVRYLEKVLASSCFISSKKNPGEKSSGCR
jgi:hypothetical protein